MHSIQVNMKYNRMLLPAILLMSLLFGACEDFLDINTDPNQASSAELRSLLPPAIERTSLAHYQAGFSTAQVTQHMGSYFPGGVDSYEEFEMGGAWTTLYLSAMSNLNTLIQQADASNSPHYAGIGRVLMAVNLGLVTDCWENAPYNEAFKAAGLLKPAYDNQQALYASINSLLERATTDLGASASVFQPADDDLIYKGNLAKWTKAAKALKARYAIHLTNKGAANAAQLALENLNGALGGNADDFQLLYNAVNLNPWHVTPALANGTGNFTIAPAAQLINMMNGTLYGVIDPRLPFMARAASDTVQLQNYRGLVSGTGTGGNVNLSTQTWYAATTAPIMMMTFAEQKFIEAEAYFIRNEAGPAYTAYLTGIGAHLDKLGVPSAERDAYLSDPRVDVGQGNLTLAHILKEKYIALYLNPEAWVDLRRHNYDNSLYQGFGLPAGNLGVYPQRAMYPIDERTRNGDNYLSARKNFDAKMWRDIP